MKKEKKTKEKERGRKIDQENWTDEGHPGYLPNISLARKIVFGLHVFTCTLFCWECWLWSNMEWRASRLYFSWSRQHCKWQCYKGACEKWLPTGGCEKQLVSQLATRKPGFWMMFVVCLSLYPGFLSNYWSQLKLAGGLLQTCKFFWCCYTVVCRRACSLGRANSTNSSISTGQAPEWRKEQESLQC